MFTKSACTNKSYTNSSENNIHFYSSRTAFFSFYLKCLKEELSKYQIKYQCHDVFIHNFSVKTVYYAGKHLIGLIESFFCYLFCYTFLCSFKYHMFNKCDVPLAVLSSYHEPFLIRYQLQWNKRKEYLLKLYRYHYLKHAYYPSTLLGFSSNALFMDNLICLLYLFQ